MSLVCSKSRIPFADAETRPAEEIQAYSRWKKLRRWVYRQARAHLLDAGIQLVGMWGLFPTYRRTLGWAWQLARGKIERRQEAPASRIPMRSPHGGAASHAIPGTPMSRSLPVKAA